MTAASMQPGPEPIAAGQSLPEGVARIALAASQGAFTYCDKADFEALDAYAWYLHVTPSGKSYARTKIPVGIKGRWVNVSMHRMLMQAKKGQRIDHVNADGLDNRRANLRFCTNQENLRNQRYRPHSSRFKGVYWHKQDRRWRACITIAARTKQLGSFKNEHDAARAYDRAALKHFGQFARTNGLEQECPSQGLQDGGYHPAPPGPRLREGETQCGE